MTTAHNPGYDGADYSDPATPARITFNDAVAELIATAIQGGVKITDLQADVDAQLSLHTPPEPAPAPVDEEAHALAYASADDCDTCWYLCSDQTDIPQAYVNIKLRAHLASGHRTTSDDEHDARRVSGGRRTP